MKTMAIDMSSMTGSLAVLDGDKLLAETRWIRERRGALKIFEATRKLMNEAGIEWEDIDLFGVGRGPGNYSGLRISLSVFSMFALPDEAVLATVSSGEALAFDVMNETNADRVTVVGDARRGMVWYGTYENDRTARRAIMSHDWSLSSPDKLAEKIHEATLFAGSNWNFISESLGRNMPSDSRIFERDVEPAAAYIGLALHRRTLEEREAEPCQPIYVHPPVVSPAAAEHSDRSATS